MININIIGAATVWADGIYFDLPIREIDAHLVRIRIGLVSAAPGTEPGATLVTYTLDTSVHFSTFRLVSRRVIFLEIA